MPLFCADGILRFSWRVGLRLRYCNRVIVIDSGEIVKTKGDGSPDLDHKHAELFREKDIKDDRNDPGSSADTKRKKVLNIKRFCKSYSNSGQSKKVLKGVSLNLFRGETLGIIGESGSGKSTLAKMVLNILSRYEGEMELITSNERIKNLTMPNKNIGVRSVCTGSYSCYYYITIFNFKFFIFNF